MPNALAISKFKYSDIICFQIEPSASLWKKNIHWFSHNVKGGLQNYVYDIFNNDTDSTYKQIS